jgi:hypothetical protein
MIHSLFSKLRLRLHQAPRLSHIYLRNLLDSDVTRKRDAPCLLFDFTRNTILKRYLFAAAYCLSQAGYQIYWQFRPRFLLRTHEEFDTTFYRLPFLRFVLCGNAFRKRIPLAGIVTDAPKTGEEFRPVTYFNAEENPPTDAENYYQFPLSLGLSYLFEHKRWVPANEAILPARDLTYRILFVGNCSPHSHGTNPTLAEQGILRRPEIVDLLLRDFPDDVTCLRTWADLEAFRNEGTMSPILILDASQAAVFAEEYWNLMLRSAFFVAMPGTASVHTHSLAESLACACCPILQEPGLIHRELRPSENCLAFGSPPGFSKTIREALEMRNEDIDKLRTAASKLYHSQFSPESIGKGLANAIAAGRPIWSSIFHAETRQVK